MNNENKQLNLEIIASNIRDAREGLEKLENRIKGKRDFSETELALGLTHAYYHLNFAWNIRHKTADEYGKLNEKDLKEWSRFPEELEEFKKEIMGTVLFFYLELAQSFPLEKSNAGGRSDKY